SQMHRRNSRHARCSSRGPSGAWWPGNGVWGPRPPVDGGGGTQPPYRAPSGRGLGGVGLGSAKGGVALVGVEVGAEGIAELQGAGGEVDLARVQAVDGPAERLVRTDRDDDGASGLGLGFDPLVGQEGRPFGLTVFLYHRPGQALG